MPTSMPTSAPAPAPLPCLHIRRLVGGLLDICPPPGGEEATPEVASLYLHTEARRLLDEAERACADVLPPLDYDAIRRGCNGDHAIKNEVCAFCDRYSFTDVSTLPEDTHGDAWTLVAGGSGRYAVRTLPEDADAGCTYVVVDTEDGDADATRALSREWGIEYDDTDESEAEEAAERANLEDYRENACGWPFAHNYAAQIEEYEAGRFARAGFVVVERDGQHYAGIDGGGYDFLEAHWSRVFFEVTASYGGGYVRTDAGLRRVAGTGTECP